MKLRVRQMLKPQPRLLVVECVIAAVLGLVPYVWLGASPDNPLMRWLWGQEHGRHLVYRGVVAVSAGLSPGDIVGLFVGGILDIVVFTTNWAYLREIENVVSMIANVLIFAAIWAILRGRPRTTKLWRATFATTVIWLTGVPAMTFVGSLLFAVD